MVLSHCLEWRNKADKDWKKSKWLFSYSILRVKFIYKTNLKKCFKENMTEKNNCIENFGLTWKETLRSQGKTIGDDTGQWAKHQNTCKKLKGKTNPPRPSSSFVWNFIAGTGILTNRCQLTLLGTCIWARMGGKELKAKLFTGKQNSSFNISEKDNALSHCQPHHTEQTRWDTLLSLWHSSFRTTQWASEE